MTLRKAKAASLALLVVGFTGSLLVYFGTAVIFCFIHWSGRSERIGSYLISTVESGLGYGAIAMLPGLLALTITGCCYALRAVRSN